MIVFNFFIIIYLLDHKNLKSKECCEGEVRFFGVSCGERDIVTICFSFSLGLRSLLEIVGFGEVDFLFALLNTRIVFWPFKYTFFAIYDANV
jgi:hypothetical protein